MWRREFQYGRPFVAQSIMTQCKRHARKKTAAVAGPLPAMLDTCANGLRGCVIAALLLLAWSGGRRRRAQVIELQVGDLRRLREDTSHQDQHGWPSARETIARRSSLRPSRAARSGQFGRARPSSCACSDTGGRSAPTLEGEWAAHSLRSGLVTEAGRHGIPLGELMVMTEHRKRGNGDGLFPGGFAAGEPRQCSRTSQ